MNRSGINVDFGHGFAAGEVIATRAAWFRFPWNPVRSDRAPCAVLRAAGLEPVPVMDRTGFGGFETPQQAVRALLRDVGDLVERVQLLNEPDANLAADLDGDGVVTLAERMAASPSSWVMSAFSVNEWLRKAGKVVREAGKLVVGPGLCSGQPSWARELDLSLMDELGVHIYVGDGVEYTLQLYAELGLPVRVTEYHARWRGLGRRVLGYGDAAAFCLSERMVPGFGVLEDAQALAELRALGGSLVARPGLVEVGPNGEWIGDGLLAELNRLGWKPERGEEWISLKGVAADRGHVFWSDRESRAFAVEGLKL